ncbi:MAG: hypothetical protein JRN21_10540 [Nitrososphaerota archaeon]|nr:hypothetical protein [Nitrososphaerota archaeon]MDG6912293.1 hypothetical protein [Nitrososphaerota archaeon]MDG6919688.1 hypothetical protein [Nitrososphaerota archaeon]MDG6941253.1 hypothetical protein [Nitrososphaerota archaeon]MDG6951513.1 hypothetical protein [Nitrososphaerota archaeon]
MAKPGRVRLDVRIGKETYSLLQNLANGSAQVECSAVQAAIERGMKRYWAHWFDIAATEYERLRKRHGQCQKDNELLQGLMDQNSELERFVESAGDPA